MTSHRAKERRRLGISASFPQLPLGQFLPARFGLHELCSSATALIFELRASLSALSNLRNVVYETCKVNCEDVTLVNHFGEERS